MKTRAAIKLIVFTLVLLALPCIGIGQTSKGGLPETVSYYEHVRPVFQVKCHGCHQPAKSRSGYVMTEVAALIAGRESSPAIVPNKPGESISLSWSQNKTAKTGRQCRRRAIRSLRTNCRW